MEYETEQKHDPIDRVNIGKVSVALWKHKTEDNREYYTFSVKCNRFNKETNKFEKCNGYGLNEIIHLKEAITIMLNKYIIKYDKNNFELNIDTEQ